MRFLPTGAELPCVVLLSGAVALVGCQFIAGVSDYEASGTTTASGGGGTGGQGDGGVGAAGGGGAPLNCVEVLANAEPGQPVWSAAFGDERLDTVSDVVIGEDGAIYVIGSFAGFLFADPHELTADVAVPSAFVAKLGPCGNIVWTKAIGEPNGEQFAVAGALEGGRLHVVGGFKDTFELDGVPVMHAGNDAEDRTDDVWLATLAIENGATEWVRSYGGPGEESAGGISVRDNEVVIGGSFSNGADLGDSTARGVEANNAIEGFLIAVDGSNGQFIKAETVEGPSSDVVTALSHDEMGGLVAAVTFVDSVTSPKLAMGNGLTNMLMLAYGPGLMVPTAQPFHTIGAGLFQIIIPLDIAISGDQVAVVGAFSGDVTVGANTLTADGVDGFLIKYDLNLQPQWSREVGGPGDVYNFVNIFGVFGGGAFEGDALGEVVFTSDGESIFSAATCRQFFQTADGTLNCMDQDVVLMRFNAQNGVDDWHIRGIGNGDAYPWGLGLASGDVVAAGSFHGFIAFGDDEPVGATPPVGMGEAASDIFVTRIRP